MNFCFLGSVFAPFDYPEYPRDTFSGKVHRQPLFVRIFMAVTSAYSVFLLTTYPFGLIITQWPVLLVWLAIVAYLFILACAHTTYEPRTTGHHVSVGGR